MAWFENVTTSEGKLYQKYLPAVLTEVPNMNTIIAVAKIMGLRICQPLFPFFTLLLCCIIKRETSHTWALWTLQSVFTEKPNTQHITWLEGNRDPWIPMVYMTWEDFQLPLATVTKQLVTPLEVLAMPALWRKEREGITKVQYHWEKSPLC